MLLPAIGSPRRTPLTRDGQSLAGALDIADGLVDHVLTGQTAFDQGGVDTFDLIVFDVALQQVIAVLILSDQHRAGNLRLDAHHDTGTVGAADVRQRWVERRQLFAPTSVARVGA